MRPSNGSQQPTRSLESFTERQSAKVDAHVTTSGDNREADNVEENDTN
jgi:hypothetical protein